MKFVDNDIVNDMFRAELRREERCKHKLIEHSVPGGQKTLRISCEKRYDTCQMRGELSSVVAYL